MSYVIHRVSQWREVLPHRPRNVSECREYFLKNWPRYDLKMFDVSGNRREIFIVLASVSDHIRFFVVDSGDEQCDK